MLIHCISLLQSPAAHRKQENYQGVPIYTAVVQNGWKLIHDLDGESGEELYDLNNDPEELKNLIQDPAHTAQAQKLREALKAELKHAEAPFADL